MTNLLRIAAAAIVATVAITACSAGTARTGAAPDKTKEWFCSEPGHIVAVYAYASITKPQAEDAGLTCTPWDWEQHITASQIGLTDRDLARLEVYNLTTSQVAFRQSDVPVVMRLLP